MDVSFLIILNFIYIVVILPTAPEKVGNKEDPKRDTWITLRRGNK